MKKSLVLAMAMALGVTASAYAANPFSDVPAGHWAYDSISKLAAAGIIEGYGDDTFRGDRLMTRYEMAQIVAKALAKGANVDKLAAEFADELDALGVRVAALEKKSDNVKITGQVRWNWANEKISGNGFSNKEASHRLRTRLTFTGTVNDNWKYVGLIQNDQNFRNYNGDEGINFQRAYMEGRLGGAKVTAGRFHHTLGLGDPDIYAHRFDGVKAGYSFGKVKAGAYYGKPAGPNGTNNGLYKKAWGVDGSLEIGKNLGLFGGYNRFTEGTNGRRQIANVGLKGTWDKVGAYAQYIKGAERGVAHKNGFNVEVTYGGAKAAQVGSWGIGLKYYNQGDGTYFTGSHGVDQAQAPAFGIFDNALLLGGFKGFRLAADYTVAKNMVAKVEYWDIKTKDSIPGGGKMKGKQLWTQMMITF